MVLGSEIESAAECESAAGADAGDLIPLRIRGEAAILFDITLEGTLNAPISPVESIRNFEVDSQFSETTGGEVFFHPQSQHVEIGVSV